MNLLKMLAHLNNIESQLNELLISAESRLYRLNEQHVEDLLARQELLAELQTALDFIKHVHVLGSGLMSKQIAHTIQKWSQK